MISCQDLTPSCTINKVMLYWHWVYLRKIKNVLTVTSILTLSLTDLNFKIEHANISKGKDSNFISSDNALYAQITLYTCTGAGTHSRHVLGP